MIESIRPPEIKKTKVVELIESFELRKPIERASEIAIVVAHQDDESIAYGSLIPRIPESTIIHITDGAPDDPKLWRGAEKREQYAHIRARELDIARERAGHTGEQISFEVADQKAVLHLTESVRRLAGIIEKKGIRVLMTHAYEGGHPDHDSVAFIVHAVKELLKRHSVEVSIIEAPLYRMVGSESMFQNFTPSTETKIIELDLTKDEMIAKSMLYDAHRSQEEVFNQQSENRNMSTEKEWVREAPKYDFSKLPNGGNLSHIFEDAKVKDDWQKLTIQALQELGLEGRI